MDFFVDTANIDQIEELFGMGLLDGVTTNPSLMAKEGIKGSENIKNHYQKICNIVDGDVSAEVLSEKFDDMLLEGRELALIHPNIVVKVPLTIAGIKVIRNLSAESVKTNCTLVFSENQALIAAKANSTYVSPFIGRLDDISMDGIELIENIRTIFDNYLFETKILAASIRHPIHVLKCAKLGVDVVTAPHFVFLKLFEHPLTSKGLMIFNHDAKKIQL